MVCRQSVWVLCDKDDMLHGTHIEPVAGWLFWTIKHANKWLFTSNCHFNATFFPSRALSGNNHPAVNSSMPNNFHAIEPVAIALIAPTDYIQVRFLCIYILPSSFISHWHSMVSQHEPARIHLPDERQGKLRHQQQQFNTILHSHLSSVLPPIYPFLHFELVLITATDDECCYQIRGHLFKSDTSQSCTYSYWLYVYILLWAVFSSVSFPYSFQCMGVFAVPIFIGGAWG